MKAFLRETIALNRWPATKSLILRGRNSAITNAAETVWGDSSNNYVRLSAAAAMEIVSSSANDAAAGTGARTVYVEGLDGNYNVISQTATLNGTTPVALSTMGDAIAINRIYVATAGSGLTNAGTITVRTVTGSVAKRQITTGATLGLGQDADFIYTIPANYLGLLSTIEFSVTGPTHDITCYLNSHASDGVLKNEGAGKCALSASSILEGKGKIFFGTGLYLPEKTLLELRCIMGGASSGDVVAMAELIVLHKNDSGLV